MRLVCFFLFISCFIVAQDDLLIESIEIVGNKKTKDFIIEREIPFASGYTIKASDTTSIKQLIIQNLTNINLFNSIDVSFRKNAFNSAIKVQISVQERWYWWPNPKFEIIERNVVTWWNNGRNLERANYGLFLSHFNFRGRREILRLKVKLGYVQTIGFDYDNPFLTQKGKWGYRAAYHYLTRHEIPVTSENAKWVFLKDEDNLVRTEHQSFLQFYYRPKFFVQHKFSLNYRNAYISDTVKINYPFYLNNELNNLQFFSLKYEYRMDNRNDKDFPTNGSYLEGSLEKIGLFNKTVDNISLTAEWKKFYPISSKWFLAHGIRASYVMGKVMPTYTELVLGRRELPRSYDAYLIHGQSYAVARTNLRYRFLDKSSIKLPKLGSRFNNVPLQCYFSIFGDIGYVDDFSDYRVNGLNNTLLNSVGIGFESLTFYDIVSRVEYSVNHLGESGIFIHLTAPI